MMTTLRFFSICTILLLVSCQNNGVKETSTNIAPEKINIDANIQSNKPQVKFPIHLSNDFLMGKFDPRSHTQFVNIDAKYADREGMQMDKDAYIAFRQMHAAAKRDGITLTIRSATRNFDYQKGIWERKWTGQTLLEGTENASIAYPNSVERAVAILKYSSMPGTSRHHWGTDIDLNAFNNAYFETGQGKKEFDWLDKNAIQYGFCRPYTKLGSDRNSGYQEEKWHWSFMQNSLPYTVYAEKHFENEMISGFQGSEVAPILDVKQNYILGISSSCKTH